MQKKTIVLQNRGMNRDTSVSKIGQSAAYENRNIRIVARDHDTLLSVTNERGTKEIVLDDDELIEGTPIGWNVLNNHLILFTHDENALSNPDYIYRFDYDGESFHMVKGLYPSSDSSDYAFDTPLYQGDLGFSTEHPIESVVYYETESVQKIYWVDGIHVLRFMNFMTPLGEIEKSDSGWDDTFFDSDRQLSFSASAVITKDNSGNPRPNGTVQYMMTYMNKYGQETGFAWVSDLVYLSPVAVGGSADGENNNKITLTFTGLDKSYGYFRVYSVFRSSLDGEAVCYLVSEQKVDDDPVLVTDDGAHLTVQDTTRLLYLGSQDVHPGTMTHKDQVLFLGDLVSVGQDYTDMEYAVKALYNAETGISSVIQFEYTTSRDSIPYPEDGGTYIYASQLTYSSSDILTFKGGEKYRFALAFRTKNGVLTRAFWIGDKVNRLYPVMDANNNVIRRVVAKCDLGQSEIMRVMNDLGLSSVQLMIAEATYADRSVQVQGIVNPTMFNVWERYNSRMYAFPSWISRPRGSEIACKHFDVVRNSVTSSGEIQCNYWETEADPTPHYVLKNGKPDEEYDGGDKTDHMMIVYQYWYEYRGTFGPVSGKFYKAKVFLIKGHVTQPGSAAVSALEGHSFTAEFVDDLRDGGTVVAVPTGDYELVGYGSARQGEGNGSSSIKKAWSGIVSFLKENGVTNSDYIIDYDVFEELCENLTDDADTFYHVQGYDTSEFTDLEDALNGHHWTVLGQNDGIGDDDYMSAYYKKHLMFVDENIVTLDSPELSYEAVSFDNASDYKFRIVGISKITAGYSDYTVVASHGKANGANLIRRTFAASSASGNLDGLTAWPLWNEKGLKEKENIPDDPKDRDSGDYDGYGEALVRYWLYMWHHDGKIDSYTDPDEGGYSVLQLKVFANMRYSHYTMYSNLSDRQCSYSPGPIRIARQMTNQYLTLEVGNERKYYNGYTDTALTMPNAHKYPILYSAGTEDMADSASSNDKYLFVQDMVRLNYLSDTHAVIPLPTEPAKAEGTGIFYEQTVLPFVWQSDMKTELMLNPSSSVLPWKNLSGDDIYYRIHYDEFRPDFDSRCASFEEGDRYLFIGEIYKDYDADGVEDLRYGGITDSAVRNCRFIPAGPQYSYDDVTDSGVIYANQGDTYFQRWDCLKTRPASGSTVNGVIDITSVMLETHINIDGRTDLQRGIPEIASIEPSSFGSLNTVYSQQNNFVTSRVLDDGANTDSYRSTLTWTLEKTDMADVDEWTHITLATNLKLDADKGPCNALRRLGNSILAFQDRGISEILFNSRTQLGTTSGVPIEIANSGKVDGKRYVTNKYGCTNKWSITEGKSALYFVDNINKAFCAFGGEGIRNLSSALGFDVWFRKMNETDSWNLSFNNFISFYDRIHSDVYIVAHQGYSHAPCLVYNELLGVFTSFFDYGSVPMMANVDDRFISFYDHRLWFQNEGGYCNFYGSQYPFWVQYRATPDPYGDKIWTNVEYRADFYRILDEDYDGESIFTDEGNFTDASGVYQANETFDYMRFWDEYQTTASEEYYNEKPKKDFRIWRMAIPRAIKTDTNIHGLDRIRNPWLNLLFKKGYTGMADESIRDMMQLHDVIVTYFE